MIVECKFWHGTEEFLKAISQLFDRYLTLRDTKAALLIFVTNKDFTNVISTIKNEIKKHQYFFKENTERGRSFFSYVFRLAQDKDKLVDLYVIAFHFYK